MKRVERWRLWRWPAFAGLLLGIIVGTAVWRRSTDVEAAVEAAGGRVMWENDPNTAQKLMARVMGRSDGSAVSLVLIDTDIDDDWLRAHRSGMQRVADGLSLSLTNTRITDVGLGHLRDLATINLLHLDKTGVTDAGLDHLRSLPNLEVLAIDHTGVTDEGLNELSSFPKVWLLCVDSSQMTGGGVAHLRNCRTLRWLTIRVASDEAVARIADFDRIERLHLDGTGITDASVPVLSGMMQLDAITFVDDSLTEEGYESLQQALPDCMMTRLKGDEIDSGNSD